MLFTSGLPNSALAAAWKSMCSGCGFMVSVEKNTLSASVMVRPVSCLNVCPTCSSSKYLPAIGAVLIARDGNRAATGSRSYHSPRSAHPATIPAMIYEYRAYYAAPGRMPDIQKRFNDVTMKLFAKHGIKVIGFWDTIVGESNELVYICAFDDLAHRQKAWAAFQDDPEWIAARKASEARGEVLEEVRNKIRQLKPFSPMR